MSGELHDTSNLVKLRNLADKLSNVEYELAYSNALLAAIVANAAEAIIGKDNDGKITAWNPAAEKLYGYSQEEAVGESVNIIIPPEKHEEFNKIMEGIKEGISVVGLVTQRLMKDGRRRDIVITISPIKDLRGAIVGASSIGRPVTWKDYE